MESLAVDNTEMPNLSVTGDDQEAMAQWTEGIFHITVTLTKNDDVEDDPCADLDPDATYDQTIEVMAKGVSIDVSEDAAYGLDSSETLCEALRREVAEDSFRTDINELIDRISPKLAASK